MNVLELYSGNQVSVNGTNSALATSNRNASFEAGDVIRVDALSTTAEGRVFVNLILDKIE